MLSYNYYNDDLAASMRICCVILTLSIFSRKLNIKNLDMFGWFFIFVICLTNKHKKMKALLIDPAQKTVTEIELDGSLPSIYKALGCSVITSVVSFSNDDTMYADDEGLFSDEITGGIMLPDWSYPVVNKIIVMGTDKNGESVDVKTPMHLLAKQIRWISKEMAESWAEQFH